MQGLGVNTFGLQVLSCAVMVLRQKGTAHSGHSVLLVLFHCSEMRQGVPLLGIRSARSLKPWIRADDPIKERLDRFTPHIPTQAFLIRLPRASNQIRIPFLVG